MAFVYQSHGPRVAARVLNKNAAEISPMSSVAFITIMRAFQTEGTPCRVCIFAPWVALLSLCLFSALFRRTEAVCVDLVRLGLHATALAVLFPYSASQTYACSLHALMVCSWSMCRSDVSTCVMCLYGTVTLLALAHQCPFRIDAGEQLYAMAWPSSVDIGVWILQRMSFI